MPGRVVFRQPQSRRSPRKRRRSAFPRLSARKLLPILGSILIAVFYTFFAPHEDGMLQGLVTRVVDGDTIHVNVMGEDRTVRLLGVDTPETVHPDKPVEYYGREASDFTTNALLFRNVWLEYDKTPLDKYQRHLAYVWLEPPVSDERSIRRGMFNAHLLLQGYAKVMTANSRLKYEGLFRNFQQEARSQRRGLWKRR